MNTELRLRTTHRKPRSAKRPSFFPRPVASRLLWSAVVLNRCVCASVCSSLVAVVCERCPVTSRFVSITALPCEAAATSALRVSMLMYGDSGAPRPLDPESVLADTIGRGPLSDAAQRLALIDIGLIRCNTSAPGNLSLNVLRPTRHHGGPRPRKRGRRRRYDYGTDAVVPSSDRTLPASSSPVPDPFESVSLAPFRPTLPSFASDGALPRSQHRLLFPQTLHHHQLKPIGRVEYGSTTLRLGISNADMVIRGYNESSAR